jgi:peptidyl-tRNA hydrolase, PTH1 family
MSKFLIAGLGNIGDEYSDTRHNIGFNVVDFIAAEEGVKWKNERYAFTAEFKFKGRQIILIKPTTYMNLSGEAVRYWLQAEKIRVENLLVIVDELALPFGKMKLNPKGSDGGHNGLKSIQECLGTTIYPRLRFGIGNEHGKGYNANYVLGKWTDEEKKLLPERIKKAAEGAKSFAFIGLERTANFVNS